MEKVLWKMEDILQFFMTQQVIQFGHVYNTGSNMSAEGSRIEHIWVKLFLLFGT